tara:strand:+ start:414 stop:1121 length:708 start_codon:yes stop_codon:yes gene_type:complete
MNRFIFLFLALFMASCSQPNIDKSINRLNLNLGAEPTINLIDGVDGLAAGVVAISSLFISVVAFSVGQIEVIIIAVVLSGVASAFLNYNYYPAQIFMGDTGAMFLGYVLSVIAISGVLKSTIAISLIFPLLILGIPISDTIFAIFRRLKDRRQIFHSDTEHIHHHLLNQGFSHRQVSYLIYIATIFLGIVAVLLSLANGIQFFILLLGLLLTILLGVALVLKRKSVVMSFLNLFL